MQPSQLPQDNKTAENEKGEVKPGLGLLGGRKHVQRELRSMHRGTPVVGNQDENHLPTSQFISINLLRTNPNQPRRNFDPALEEELAASIREHGILEPLLVRPVEDGEYLIVAGERRYRAAKAAGVAKLPVIIRSDLDQQKADLFALVENLQRADLSEEEEATFFLRLQNQHNYTGRQIAALIHKSDNYVSKRLKRLAEDYYAKARPNLQLDVETEPVFSTESAVELAQTSPASGHSSSDVIHNDHQQGSLIKDSQEKGNSRPTIERQAWILPVATLQKRFEKLSKSKFDQNNRTQLLNEITELEKALNSLKDALEQQTKAEQG